MRATRLEQLSTGKLSRRVVGYVPGLEISSEIAIRAVFGIVLWCNQRGLKECDSMDQLALVVSGNRVILTCGNKNAKAIALALLPCLCRYNMLVHLVQRADRIFGNDGEVNRFRTVQGCKKRGILDT
jgi:hypothetical protein